MPVVTLRRGAVVLLWGAVASVVAGGCNELAGLEEFSVAGQQIPQEPPHPCDVLPKTKPSEHRKSLLRLVKTTEGCFWIDETEVTVFQYEQWIQKNGNFSDWDVERCSWKPAGASDPAGQVGDSCRKNIESELNPFHPNKPIRCVDWCDAEAFCRSMGDHLCYRQNDGGSTEPGGVRDEWRLACGINRLTVPDLDGCNVDQAARGCNQKSLSCGPIEVGTLPRCVSPSGVHDLFGNLGEWTFSCSAIGQSNPETSCAVLGGDFSSVGDDAIFSCTSFGILMAKNERRPSVGFRCCSEISIEEKAKIELQ